MYYVIEQKEAQATGGHSSSSFLDSLNSDLMEQAGRVKQHIRNRSAGKRTPTPSHDQQRPTAHTLQPSRYSTLQTPEFTHPWTLAPKARTLRLKTEHTRLTAARTEEAEQMLDRITIHCLRANRRSADQRAASLDTRFSYTVRKLEHLKSQRQKEQTQAKRLRQLRQEDKAETEFLINTVTHLTDEDRSNRERLRQRVLSQRTARQQVLEGVQREKARVAYQQRLSASQLRTEKKELESYAIYEKRLICHRERQGELQTRRKRRQGLESKKNAAKARFKNKWMEEFELASRAEHALTEKEHAFEARMQQAISNFVQLP